MSAEGWLLDGGGDGTVLQRMSIRQFLLNFYLHLLYNDRYALQF
jgi:hypothetical protein